MGQLITDRRLVPANVDRLTVRAHIIETAAESFRLPRTRKSRGALISGCVGGRRSPPPG
jgi:hypothetical protein